MTLQVFASLVPVFVLGAMSPGPSLAVVLRNSLAGGRRHGVATGIGHGLGFGLYAFLAAAGMAAAIAASEAAGLALRAGGAALLVYLGYTYLKRARSAGRRHGGLSAGGHTGGSGMAQGFLTAFLNPKILAWLLAVYSPVIDADLAVPALLGIALMGLAIDMTWYVTVALFMTSSTRGARLVAASGKLETAMGLLMFVLAGLLVSDLL